MKISWEGKHNSKYSRRLIVIDAKSSAYNSRIYQCILVNVQYLQAIIIHLSKNQKCSIEIWFLKIWNTLCCTCYFIVQNEDLSISLNISKWIQKVSNTHHCQYGLALKSQEKVYLLQSKQSREMQRGSNPTRTRKLENGGLFHKQHWQINHVNYR